MSNLLTILTPEFKAWLLKHKNWVQLKNENYYAAPLKRMNRLEQAARCIQLEMDLVAKEVADTYRAEKVKDLMTGKVEALKEWADIKAFIEKRYKEAEEICTKK